MNRKLAVLCTAGLAAIALTAGGSTFAAFSDFNDVTGNSLGAGYLELDFTNPDTTALATPFTYAFGQPGDTGQHRLIWVANDQGSTPSGSMSVSLTHLQDTPASCSVAFTKAIAETASQVGGCAADGTGTPVQGNLSRVVTFSVVDDPSITTAAGCRAAQQAGTGLTDQALPLFAPMRGDLFADAGTAYPVIEHDPTQPLVPSATVPVDFAPGSGICLDVSAVWTSSPALTGTPDQPTDAAAQGDSLTFDLRVELDQELGA